MFVKHDALNSFKLSALRFTLHSVFKLETGLATDALIARKLMVRIAIKTAVNPERGKTHTFIFIR